MSVGMVRIRAKAVQPPRSPEAEFFGCPEVNGILPSWCDVEVFVVHEDGTEVPFYGVRSVTFAACEGNEPLKATIECYVDEIDVLASTESALEPIVPAAPDTVRP